MTATTAPFRAEASARRAHGAGRVPAARVALGLGAILLAACGEGDGATPQPEPVSTSTTEAEPTGGTALPTDAFAALGDDEVPPEVAAKLQSILDGMASGGGVTATVFTPEGRWSGAAGTADGVDSVRVESQFGIASGTKPIIAAQVLQLVEADVLSLDAPAAEHLPADLGFDANGATIRQLLGMRSGIPDWYSDAVERQMAVERDRIWRLDEVLDLVGPERGPLGIEDYADTNYNLLGLIIEHAAERPLVEVLRSGVLRVEGTGRLVFQPGEAPTDPMAMPRAEPRAALEQGRGYLPSISDATSSGAAAAVASDSVSLARWWRALCAGEIISRASLEEMSTFVDGPGSYGLGVAEIGSEYGAEGIGHLGSNFGYISSAGCLTDEHPVVFVVLTNSRSGHGPDLAVPIVQAVRSR